MAEELRFRQFLTESAVLALAGGALGVLLAVWGAELIVALFSSWRQPLVLDVSLNVRVLAFASAVALATGFAFGVAPALNATAVDFTPILKGGQTGLSVTGGRSLVSSGIIVAQIALYSHLGILSRTGAARAARGRHTTDEVLPIGSPWATTPA
jgi:hypothetical protein